MTTKSGPGDVGDGGTERASVARMYDFMLGGARNLGVDRETVEELLPRSPGMVGAVWALRHFMRRSVKAAAQLGIDQFLDLGSGMPTAGNLHDVARTVNPSARVAYIDSDPVAAAELNRFLAGVSDTSVTHADLIDVGVVLGAPGVVDLLDFQRPVAVVILSVLHFVPDFFQVQSLVSGYRRHLVPGSALLISHGSDDYDDPGLVERVRAVQRLYSRNVRPTTLRSRADVRALLDGTDIIEPGVVDLARWRPETTSLATGEVRSGVRPARGVGAYGAVGVVKSPTQSA